MDNYIKTEHIRPSDETNPDVKQNNPEYSLDMSRYIYYLYDKDATEITSSDRDRFLQNRLYARGKQSTEIYKDFLLDDDAGSPAMGRIDSDGKVTKKHRKGFMNVNFDQVFSPLPKLLQAIVGVLEGQEHNVFAQAIDENSMSIREDMKSKAIIKGMFAQEMAKLNRLMGIDYNEEQAVPKNAKELQLFDSLGAFKLKYEIGIQKAVDHTMKRSNIRDLKRRIIKDLVTIGYGASEYYYDRNTGEVKLRYLDPSNVIIEKSSSPTFDDSSFYAHIEYMTLFDIKYETGLTDDELYGLAQNYAGKHGNSQTYSWEVSKTGFYDFYNCRVPVLKSKWKSNDYEYRTKRKNKVGEELDFHEPYRGKDLPKVYDKDTRKTYRVSRKTLYQACWIIDSDIVFDFGRVHGSPFDYKKKDVPLGINMYRIDETPIMESCIPIEDQIMLTHLRLQNAIAVSPPPGLAIEYSSLMGMSMEDDDWSPMDVLKLRSQSGNMLFNVSPNGVEMPPNYPDPIRELTGGLGTAINDAAQSFEMSYNNLRVITGIDDITVAARPVNDQGKAVTELAVSATINTLKPIYAGYLSIKEGMALNSVLKIQSLMLTGEGTAYKDIIGEGAVAALIAAGNKSPVQLGIHLVAAPDDQLKQEIRAAAQSALAGGKNGVPALNYSEYLFIIESLNSMSGIASARLYIAMKEAEREKKEREFALMSQEKQSKEVQAQNKQKAEYEMMKLEKEKERDLAKIEAEKIADSELENIKHNNRMAEIRLERSLEPVSTEKY